jgi:Uma2 family endonuclease
MSQIVSPSVWPGAGEPDPFRYGWKEEYQERPDGTRELVYLPLTLEDILHPEENYKIANSGRHNDECSYLKVGIRFKLRKNPHALVLSDTNVYWDDPTLKHHSPDISLFFGVRETRKSWPSFFVADEGVRPVLIIEVVSPLHRVNDVQTKLEQYYQAGVPWYIIADRIQNEGPPTLIGYRHTPQGYVEFRPDEQGRLLLEPLGLKLGVHGDRLALFDAGTGEELGEYEEVRADLLAEQEARLRAEREKQLAEERAADAQRTLTEAEERAQSQEQARKVAEDQRLAAEQARKLAEDRRLAAEQARQAADDQCLAAEQARKTAEDRRLAAEQARKLAEDQRRAAEQARKTAEDQRLAAQRARQAAEAEQANLSRRLAELEAELQRRSAGTEPKP